MRKVQNQNAIMVSHSIYVARPTDTTVSLPTSHYP